MGERDRSLVGHHLGLLLLNPLYPRERVRAWVRAQFGHLRLLHCRFRPALRERILSCAPDLSTWKSLNGPRRRRLRCAGPRDHCILQHSVAYPWALSIFAV